ncbi:MAG: type II secretion system F family protein [Vulcanimicrobiaceae bacterium]
MSLTFTYCARTPSGERVVGSMRALDRNAALATLRERLLIPSDLRAAAGGFSFASLLRRPQPRERLTFFRAYAALEEAGIDFSTAFDLLIAQARTSRFRDALASIKSDVERGGERLAAAMSHRPNEFTDLEVAMVAAGEEAGNREEIFDRLAAFLERDERLRKRLGAALLYPAIVVAAAAAISLYLIGFIVPQFAALFASFGVALSPLMQALVAISTLARSPATLALGVALALVAAVAFARGLATTQGALLLDRGRFALPVLGGALRKAIFARLARVLATLLQSGINQVRALEVAVPVAESALYASAVERARELLAGGVCASLDEALAATAAFPSMLLGFARVGHSAGNVPAMLVKVAEYYEEDVESVLASLPAVIQTLVTIALGIVVALIVYVVYVPLSTLSSSIR